MDYVTHLSPDSGGTNRRGERLAYEVAHVRSTLLSMRKGLSTQDATRKTQRRTVENPRNLPQATLRWIEDAGRVGRTIPAELRKLALTVKK